MKLIRFGLKGFEKPGVILADGSIKDCSAHASDYDHTFFSSGGIERLRAVVKAGELLPDAPAGVRIGAPVARPRNVLAIGLN